MSLMKQIENEERCEAEGHEEPVLIQVVKWDGSKKYGCPRCGAVTKREGGQISGIE